MRTASCRPSSSSQVEVAVRAFDQRGGALDDPLQERIRVEQLRESDGGLVEGFQLAAEALPARRHGPRPRGSRGLRPYAEDRLYGRCCLTGTPLLPSHYDRAMELRRWHAEPIEQLNESIGRQMLHTETMTVARIYLAAGAVVPRHQHENEQVANVISGRLRFVVGEEELVVGGGRERRAPGERAARGDRARRLARDRRLLAGARGLGARRRRLPERLTLYRKAIRSRGSRPARSAARRPLRGRTACASQPRLTPGHALAVRPSQDDLRADAAHQAAEESRREAVPLVLSTIVLQTVLSVVSWKEGWTLWVFPGWVWGALVLVELVALAPIAVTASHRALVQAGRRRHAALVLAGIVGVVNVCALAALLVSLVTGDEKSGEQLLFEGAVIWATNVTVFALVYWELDRGGPVRRRQPDPPPADFQFPQMENVDRNYIEPDWRPGVLDYVYVSFTNALAFSPTDAMPLSREAKSFMLTEAALSAVTVLLVAARAVNVLGS